MTTVNVFATQDYSREALGSISQISFLNKTGAPTATFAASQFQNKVSLTLNVTGNITANTIVVIGSDVEASHWTFDQWKANQDYLILEGTTGADTLMGGHYGDMIYGGAGDDIIGPSGGDWLFGGTGIDTCFGGDGNDTFRLSAPGACDIFGGSGNDTVELFQSQFSSSTLMQISLSEVETLSLGNCSGVSFYLSSTQPGKALGGVKVISAGTAHDLLVVLIPWRDTDYRDITYLNWTADNWIVIRVQVDEIIHGSGTREYFDIAADGSGALYGGGGGDVFMASDGLDNIAICGGAGVDRIWIDRPYLGQPGVVLDDLRGFGGIEVLEFHYQSQRDGLPSVHITADQMASGVKTIIGGGLAESVTVQLYGAQSQSDLSHVKFVDWIVDSDSLTVNGSEGNNSITCFKLDTRIYGMDGNDLLNGGDGKDWLFGGAGNDTISGGNGVDMLYGDAGDDTFIFSSGLGTMYGGSGHDRFVLLAMTDTGATDGSDDQIRDFVQGDDIIDLSATDAKPGLGDNAFAFIGSRPFDFHKGQLNFAVRGGVTVVAGDINGDGTADFQIEIAQLVALLATDFVL